VITGSFWAGLLQDQGEAWTQEAVASWECDVPTLLPISLPLMSVIGVLATALSSWGRAMLLRSLFCYTGP